MTYDLLERELNSGKLHSIYLFYGDEKFLIETAIKKIKKNFGELLKGINYVIIDESLLNDLISNIETPAFGYDKKLIIVKNSGLFKKDGRKKAGSPIQETIAKYINENMDVINENVIIIFYENEVDKNNVFDAVNKNGVVCEVKELNQIQLIKRLKHICNGYKVNVNENILGYLVEASRNKFTNFNKRGKKINRTCRYWRNY